MPDDTRLEARIRERAHKIWIEDGRPEGREHLHWERARLAIAEEEGLASTLKRPDPPTPEPIEAVSNQAEFPTLTDQGEAQQIPQRKRSPQTNPLSKRPGPAPPKRRK